MKKVLVFAAALLLGVAMGIASMWWMQAEVARSSDVDTVVRMLENREIVSGESETFFIGKFIPAVDYRLAGPDGVYGYLEFSRSGLSASFYSFDGHLYAARIITGATTEPSDQWIFADVDRIATYIKTAAHADSFTPSG